MSTPELTRFPLKNAKVFKEKCIQWANQFQTFLVLDSNTASDKYSKFDCIIAIDALKEIRLNTTANAFEHLEDFHEKTPHTLFGYLSYDLKNSVEKLQSSNSDELEMPDLYFFQARYEIHITSDSFSINRSTMEALYIKDSIEQTKTETYEKPRLSWQKRTDKNDYINQVEQIRRDIAEGTVYELNYCYEHFAEQAEINPTSTFSYLNEKVKAPFSSFLKLNHQFALSFSPERFMQHNKGALISQPIKGTRKKTGKQIEDKALAIELANDEKERAENVMIVDLVRNDFARSAIPGTVKVPELFGIYTFENIIQMISTVEAQKRDNVSAIHALKMCFPMGSMTGAPKIKAMELIEQYENTKRGLYSGAIGYIEKNGNFDFNVVIRSLIYNASKKYLSYHVGGAITYDSVAVKEWEETLTKAESVLDYLK